MIFSVFLSVPLSVPFTVPRFSNTRSNSAIDTLWTRVKIVFWGEFFLQQFDWSIYCSMCSLIKKVCHFVDCESSLLDETASKKHFLIWFKTFVHRILLYFSFCSVNRWFVKFFKVWFLSLHFSITGFTSDLILQIELVS